MLLLVLTMMLLAEPEPYRRGFRRLFPKFYRPRIDQILDRSHQCLQMWLRETLFRMTVIGTLSFLGLSTLEIPLALTQAILAAIFTFIPNIGIILSVIPPLAIALLDCYWKAIGVLIIYCAIGIITNYILTPLIIKQKQLSVLPLTSVLGQVFFYNFFGLIGLFLALPLTIIARVWLQEILIEDILNQWKLSRQNQPQEEGRQEQLG